MRSEPARQSILLPLVGVVLLTLPTFLMVRWIAVWNRVTTYQADRVSEWLAVLPSPLRDAGLATTILILLSAGGTVAGLLGVIRLTRAAKIASVVPLAVGGLLTLWFRSIMM